jgi:N-acetylmuramoyl-L-alanine amidase
MVSQKNVYLPMAWLRDLLGIKLIEDRITKSLFIYRPTTPIVDEGTATSLSAKSTVTLAESAALLQEITVSNDELKILTSTDVSTAKVFRLQFPERIVIDLPGVSIDRSTQSATNGMVQVDSDHPWVNKIRFSQFITSPASVRVVLETKSIVLFSKQIIADGKGVAIRFTEQKPITVMIDAGHGGKDPGAISPKGHFEKDFTLILANKVNDLLQREPMIIPILSRTDDTASTPLQRATLANESKVDLLISLHANTFKQSSVRGTETFYWTDDSKSLAMILHKHVLAAFGSIDRKVRKERFVILRETTMPAALLEVGYMTNAMDESKLLDEQVQNQVAEAIVIAIKEYVDSQ